MAPAMSMKAGTWTALGIICFPSPSRKGVRRRQPRPCLITLIRSCIAVVFIGKTSRDSPARCKPPKPHLKSFSVNPRREELVIRENGVNFAIRFNEGASVGLFLDQRDNRRRLLTNHVAAGFPLFPNGAAGVQVLNVFAYTCAFSVCAARAGATTTSLDLSRKYLDWGRRNFQLNGLDPAQHDFIYGDAFDWLRRLAKKGRTSTSSCSTRQLSRAPNNTAPSRPSAIIPNS